MLTDETPWRGLGMGIVMLRAEKEMLKDPLWLGIGRSLV
jgi:hypothetical protein